jgi:hypothetical protein
VGDLLAVEPVHFVVESMLVVQFVRRLVVGSKLVVSLELEEKRLLSLLLEPQIEELSRERICSTRSLTVEMVLRWAVVGLRSRVVSRRLDSIAGGNNDFGEERLGFVEGCLCSAVVLVAAGTGSVASHSFALEPQEAV